MLLNEIAIRRHGINRASLVRAMQEFRMVEGEPSMTLTELNAKVGEFLAQFRFPLIVYRGLSWEDMPNWDARTQRVEGTAFGDMEKLYSMIGQIDWGRIGVWWTFDRTVAISGGPYGEISHCHCLLTTRVSSSQIDWIGTIWQNFEIPEEKEIRLHENSPIWVSDIHPNPGYKLPMRTNTGQPNWDRTEKTINYIKHVVHGEPLPNASP